MYIEDYFGRKKQLKEDAAAIKTRGDRVGRVRVGVDYTRRSRDVVIK